MACVAHSKGFFVAANFVDAVASVVLVDFGGGGFWRWPLFVEGDLALAETSRFGVRQLRRFLRAQTLVDSDGLD